MLKLLFPAVAGGALLVANAPADAAIIVNFANGNNIGTTLTDPVSGTDFTVDVATASELRTAGTALSSILATSGGGLGVNSTGSNLNDGGQDLDNTFGSANNNGVLESLLFTFSPAGATTAPVDVVIDAIRVQNVNNGDEGVTLSNGLSTPTLTQNSYGGSITGGSSTPTFQDVGFTLSAGQTLTITATDGGSVRVRDLELAVTPIPEPTALGGLLGLGMLGLRRRR
jgi:hypothetical protein